MHTFRCPGLFVFGPLPTPPLAIDQSSSARLRELASIASLQGMSNYSFTLAQPPSVHKLGIINSQNARLESNNIRAESIPQRSLSLSLSSKMIENTNLTDLKVSNEFMAKS